jgi:hypothetical protein
MRFLPTGLTGWVAFAAMIVIGVVGTGIIYTMHLLTLIGR